jgi:outer membrane immunogenic protein
MRMFAVLKLGSLSLLALPLTAYAADLPLKAPPPPVVTVYNWTGFYVGGNVGGKWDDQNSPITLGAVPGSTDPRFTTTNALHFGGRNSSVIGGGQIGYNWQFGSWVLGVEGDADAQSLRHRAAILTNGSPTGFVAGDLFDSKSDWQASARIRVGYAWGPWLAYVTGGAAFTNIKLSTNFVAGANPVNFPASAASDSQTLVGGTIGGGVEYMISRNLSIGVEGRYSDYGRETYGLGSVAILPVGSGLPFSNVTSRADLNTWEVTGRLNWHFDWTSPIVARY